ncbi:hypothetical protein [Sandaracinus amylolyticus]|uniref:Uncharacterized protein n=1 Tax=Sandaracinus amylolyticus TaxID=927083 RepID=A0A0F6W0J1_9BACT|nr:hypothetical protein [Sandaracinus amylolyticus]AKF04387.1 hypothetical protein DB32_001536 [Sandaracinus amylolyticus]
MHSRLHTSIVALCLLTGCGASFRAFPMADPMWRDDDARPLSTRPQVHYNPWAWDAVDNTTFRQLSELWTYERDREAMNVNALDEVPDSSWFTNRIGRDAMSREDLARGACSEVEAPPPPWVVIRSKPDGSGPGLVVRASDGRTYLFKVDLSQPERATAADAIASRIFHAAGYFVPCNRVIHFAAEDFTLAPDARTSGSSPRPLVRADVDAILARAGAAPNGRRRGSLSAYIDGTPLGGWRFAGLRDDDPNDVVPHEHRREVRGMYVLSAWLNHIDSRAENNMDSWIETEPGRGYVRHYVLDTGDSFGIVWPVDDALSRRFGHSHYLDIQHLGEDFVSLGLAQRAYTESPDRPEHPTFGFYTERDFVPDQWRNGYPNPGFERRTERDLAWMTRIVARLGEAELALLVEQGAWSDPALGTELLRILLARRARILERWLTRLSPLAWPVAAREGGDVEICLDDLAVSSGLRDADGRRYEARVYRGLPPRASDADARVSAASARVCVRIALPPGASEEYVVVDVIASSEGAERTAPARVHLYALSSGEARVVGLERPDSERAP